MDAARLQGAVVPRRPVDDREGAAALGEDHLEVGVPRALEVRRPPLDHELAVRCAPQHRSEHAPTGLVGAKVVLIRDERAVETVDRKRLAAARETAVVRVELQIAVRADVRARERARIDQHREGQRDERRAVVAMVPGVHGPRNDRLAALRVGRVGAATRERNARRDQRHGRRCYRAAQAEEALTPSWSLPARQRYRRPTTSRTGKPRRLIDPALGF